MKKHRKAFEWMLRILKDIKNRKADNLRTVLVCAGLLLTFVTSTSRGEEPAFSGEVVSSKNLRFYQGLRERRLYELIEMLCQRELKKPRLSEQAQLFYRIELAQTYAAHAQDVSIDQAEPLWNSAYDVLKSAADKLPSADVSAIEVERGVLRAGQAEQIFWMAIAEPDDATLRDKFTQTTRRAITELESASQIISRYLKKPAKSSDDSSSSANRLTADRFAEIEILRAKLHLHLAEIEQQNVPERTASVQRARTIAAPVAKRRTNGFREQSAKLILLRAARIQKEEAELNRLYRALNQPEIDPQIRTRATAEFARYLLAVNRVTEAAEMILKYARESGVLTAELDSLRLQALLKMAAVVRKTGETRLAEELENEVQFRLEHLEKQGESYYSWLVRKLQQQYKLELQYGPEISRKLLQARQALQEKKWPVAQSNYASVIQRAIQENRPEWLIDLGREAAAVDFQIRDYPHAANLLKSIWETSPVFPEMESIHLLLIYALGRDYVSAATQQKLSRYLETLQEHRTRYAGKATAGEATWLLAELQFARIQVTRALDLYREIPPTHPRHLAAQLRVVQCYRWILQRVKELGQPVLPWQNQAVEFATKTQNFWKDKPLQKPEQAELVLMTSQILLDAHAQQTTFLQQHIQRILDASESAIAKGNLDRETVDKWKKVLHSARAFQGILLVSRGEVDQARKLFAGEKNAPATPEERLFMARQLANYLGDTARTRQITAELILLVSDELQPGSTYYKQLTRRQAIEIRELRAEAFAHSGQTTKAVALYEQLVAEMPENRKYVNRLSSLLEQCNNQKHWEKAYELWKNQVRKEKQGTESWLEARYHLAVACINLNRSDEARKIVEVTLLLYPNIGSKDLQNRYQKLSDLLKQ